MGRILFRAGDSMLGIVPRPLLPARVPTPAAVSDCYGTQLPSSPEKCLHLKSDCPWGTKGCLYCLRWDQLCGAIDASEFSVGLV